MHPTCPQSGKIYFSKNQISNFLKQGKENLHCAIESYKMLMYQNVILSSIIERGALNVLVQIPELDSQNKSVNKLLSQVKKEAAITSNLSELYL